MKEILLAYKEKNGNATTQAYTPARSTGGCAIRTRRYANLKLQNSMLFAYPQLRTIEN